MKKLILVFIMIVVLGCFAIGIVACDSKKDGYTLTVPDGATAMAVAGIINNNLVGDSKITTSLASSENIGVSALKSDIAILPSNMAIKLTADPKNGYKMLSVITNGNLYIIGKQKLDNFGELKGKLFLSIGQKSAPDYVLQTIVKSHNINLKVVDDNTVDENYLSIRYFASGAEVISNLVALEKKGIVAYGMLAEPAVSTAMTKGFVECFDLQELWQQAVGGDIKGFPQAVLIAKNHVAKNNKFVDMLLERIKKDIDWVIEDPNRAIKVVKDNFDSLLPPTMSVGVALRNNLSVITFEKSTEYVDTFAKRLYDLNKLAIGGTLPTKDSYYYMSAK